MESPESMPQTEPSSEENLEGLTPTNQGLSPETRERVEANQTRDRELAEQEREAAEALVREAYEKRMGEENVEPKKPKETKHIIPVEVPTPENSPINPPTSEASKPNEQPEAEKKETEKTKFEELKDNLDKLNSKEKELASLIEQTKKRNKDESLVGLANREAGLRGQKNKLMKEIAETGGQILPQLKKELADLESNGVLIDYNADQKFRKFFKDELIYLKDRWNKGERIKWLERRIKEQEENEKIRVEIKEKIESGKNASAAIQSANLGFREEKQEKRFLYEQSAKNDIFKYNFDKVKKWAGIAWVLGVGTIIAAVKGVWAVVKGAWAGGRKGGFVAGCNEGWKMVNNWGKKEKGH